MKVYLPWIAFPAALFVAGALGLSPESSQLRDDEPATILDLGTLSPDGETVRDQIHFHQLARRTDDTPVSTVNQEGLAIDLSIDPTTYEHMQIVGVRGLYKRRRVNTSVRFGDLEPRPGVLRLRGSSSLRRTELNFEIIFPRAEAITETIQLKRFYLINMFFDPHEFELVFGYRVLRSLGLFPCHFQYVKVSVNGSPLGMFLLVERPRDAIRRTYPNVVSVFRRDNSEVFRIERQQSVPALRDQVRELSRLIWQDDIENAPETLRRIMDLDAYLTWLATNSLLKISDTVDEIFFFEVRTDKNQVEPMRIMAWDYDDLMSHKPNLKLMMTPEAQLDLHIRHNPELYSLYRTSLRRLLTEHLTIEFLMEQLGATVDLRNKLDDGLSAKAQERSREARNRFRGYFSYDMRMRHRELLDMLAEFTDE